MTNDQSLKYDLEQHMAKKVLKVYQVVCYIACTNYTDRQADTADEAAMIRGKDNGGLG